MHPTAPFYLSDGQVAIISLATLFALVVAALLHGRYVRSLRRRVPTVVHVAGTRGKTTTVTTLARALEERGRRVVAKTTGSEPLLLLPGGRRVGLRRLGPTSITEQETVLKVAVRERADVLVVECMAIRPELVWASHALVLRPDLCVITNTRCDHIEDLGPGPDAAASALLPLAAGPGSLVLSAEAHPRLAVEARRNGVSLLEVDTGGTIDDQTRSLVAGALRLLGCEHGPRIEVLGDAGGFLKREVVIDGRALTIADAFAANDPASLQYRWRESASAGGNVVVLAARRDRPERSLAFLRALPELRPAPTHVFVVGDARLRRYVRSNDLRGMSVEFLPPSPAEEVWRRVRAVLPPGGLAWGVGNRVQAGDALLQLGRGR